MQNVMLEDAEKENNLIARRATKKISSTRYKLEQVRVKYSFYIATLKKYFFYKIENFLNQPR